MGDVSVGMTGGRWGRKAEFACRKSESNEQYSTGREMQAISVVDCGEDIQWRNTHILKKSSVFEIIR